MLIFFPVFYHKIIFVIETILFLDIMYLKFPSEILKKNLLNFYEK